MNFLDYPEVEISQRDFSKEIELAWTGFRTCYSNKVNYDDMYPFKLNNDGLGTPELREKALSNIKDIKNFYVTELSKTIENLKTIAKKYEYPVPEYINHFSKKENLEDFFDYKVSALVEAINTYPSVKEQPVYWGYDFLRTIQACKWMYPKLRIGHGSPLEHGVTTFAIKCSRSASHQLVRHRVASYSQESQRYISEDPDNLEFIIPKEIRHNEKALDVVVELFTHVSKAIRILKEMKIRNEDIRCIYPNAITTKVQVTMNFRELRHFISLRMSKTAQDEIRKSAFDILCYLCIHVPFVFSDLAEI